MKIYKKTTLLLAMLFAGSALYAASSDASLEAIEVSNKGVNIVTGFAPATLTYSFTPSPAPTEVTLRAVPADKKAKVVISIGSASYTNNSLVGLVGGNVDILFTVTAEDGTTQKVYTVSLTSGGGGGGGGTSLETTYYSTNPNGGVGIYKTGMVVQNVSMKSEGFADWSPSMIIAQGVANDVSQSFQGGHEGPLYDTYTLYAAWDDNNLYIGWQYVNVVDAVDPAQGYPISDNGKPWNGNIPICLAFDVDPAISASGVLIDGATGVWNAPGKKFNTFENGADQLFMCSSKPGVGQPGIFKANSAGLYDNATAVLFGTAGVVYGYVDGCLPASIWGINKNSFMSEYVPALLEGTVGFVDFATTTHKKTQDTFYEMKIPFTALGISRSYIEANGIGLMLVSTFGESAIGSIPYDPTVFDNVELPYSADGSSSKEREDLDLFKYKMARIGKK